MYIQEKSPTYILPSCRSWWLSMRDTRLWRLPWQCIGVPRTNWQLVGLWWGGPNRPAKRGWGQGSVTMGTLKKGEDQFKARIMCWYLPQTAVHFQLFLMHQCMKKKKEMFMFMFMFMFSVYILPPTNNNSFKYLFMAFIDIWHNIVIFHEHST